jgi:hypothetical protein
MHTNLAHGDGGGTHILLGYLRDSLAGVSVSKSSDGGFKTGGRAFDLCRPPI